MAEVAVDGARLFYVEQGNGEPVVFVHGSLSDWRTWTFQFPALTVRYRALAYSRRYHWPNEPFPPTAVNDPIGPHVADLASLLRSTGTAPAHLVGNSLGAFICLMLASREPALVRSLVLEEPPALPLFVNLPPRPSQMLKLLFTRPRTGITVMRLGAGTLGPIAKASRAGDAETAMRLFASFVLTPALFATVPADRKDQMRANARSVVLQMRAGDGGFERFTADDVRRVRAPTLLVNGEFSPAIFYRLMDRLETLLPHAVRVRVPNASHLMHEQNPEGTNRAILGFLGDLGDNKSA